MISEIIDVVEKIRSESNISIKCFTEGIIDRREYLRLVKHEHPLTVEVLFKLVDRLKITIFQFSSYASLVLEDKYKDVIILRYLEDLKVEEISQILERPVNTIKTHIRKAIRDMKNLLKEDYIND